MALLSQANPMCSTAIPSSGVLPAVLTPQQNSIRSCVGAVGRETKSERLAGVPRAQHAERWHSYDSTMLHYLTVVAQLGSSAPNFRQERLACFVVL